MDEERNKHNTSNLLLAAAIGAGAFALLTTGAHVNAEPPCKDDGLVLRAQLDATPPPGTIVGFAGTKAPPGWLLCNGAPLDKTKYKRLFDAIGTSFGSSDDSHFNLPDLQGRFLRGVDHGKNRDPRGNAHHIGEEEDDLFQVHGHGISDQGHQHDVKAGNLPVFFSNPGPDQGNNFTVFDSRVAPAPEQLFAEKQYTNIAVTDPNSGRSGAETRPKNLAVEFIIKY